MDDLVLWLQALDRPFAFLVALPFIVAVVAWLGELYRRKRRTSLNRPASSPDPTNK